MPARPRRIRKFRAGFSWRAILALIVLSVAADTGATAQSPIRQALTPGADDAGPSASEATPEKSLAAIEAELERARKNLLALEQANPAGRSDSPAHEIAERRLRVLEQRREAQIRNNQLSLGREAIEAGLSLDPGALFGDPPPFPVPVLDGVLQAWQRAARLEQEQAIVVDDRRANEQLAAQSLEARQKERRRLRDQAKNEEEPLAKASRDAELRRLEDQIALASEQLALARQRTENAAIELEIKRIALDQATAAKDWVEAQLEPRSSDLSDAMARLDRERFELERTADLARARVSSAEQTLRTAEERGARLTDSNASATRAETFEFELTTRRRQLAHRQHLVATLNQRIERLVRMRRSWQNRYAVLTNEVELAEMPVWLETAKQQLERLTRERRITEAELTGLQRELVALRDDLDTGRTGALDVRSLRQIELDDLDKLVDFYREDIESLDRAIGLEERLRLELENRLEGRNLGERVLGFSDSVKRFWSFEITTSEDNPITPGKILIALAIFAAGYGIAITFTGILSRRFFPRLGFDSGASNAFGALSFYGLLAIAFLLALRAVDIPLTAFAVAGGALALGIGFGSQAIVSNFISGLLLLAERPIRMGDLIEIGGVVGEVEAIGLRSTRIRTADNFHIIVPNSSFLESNVINWTHQDPKIRMRVAVGVAYGSNTRRVEELLVEAAKEHPRSIGSPAPAAYFQDFGDSALCFEVRFWIRYDPRTDRSQIKSWIRFRIDELFAENGIVIAFPQIDVHLDAPVAAEHDRQ